MKTSKAYQSVEREEYFLVGIGGYRDRFDILYKEDCTKKDGGTVKRFLQSGRQHLFSHEIYEKLDLSGGRYEDLEFQYSSFGECDFSESSFSKCRFVFCNFKNSVFKDVQMGKIKIFDADFSGARLENIDFGGAKLKCISFQGAKLKNVDFSGALLVEDIRFGDAKMVDCILPESR